MNLLQSLFDWLRGATKIRANQLKGTPGLKDKDTQAAADQINLVKEIGVEQLEAKVTPSDGK